MRIIRAQNESPVAHRGGTLIYGAIVRKYEEIPYP